MHFAHGPAGAKRPESQNPGGRWRATIAVAAGRVANADRVRDGLVRAANRGPAVDGLARTATLLRRAVPFDGTCLVTLDPATLLPTGEIVENGLPAEATMRLNDIEMREADVNKFSGLAERPRPAASLSEATSGDLHRSLRQRELRRPHGLALDLDTGFSAGMFAVLAVTSATLRAPWRLRLRLVLVGYVLVGLLYLAQLADLVDHHASLLG